MEVEKRTQRASKYVAIDVLSHQSAREVVVPVDEVPRIGKCNDGLERTRFTFLCCVLGEDIRSK